MTGGGSTAYKDGGAVVGVGTGTSDSIVARLSNGEHVWTAAEVDGRGGHSEVATLRALARAGRSSDAYAFAGRSEPQVVTVPVNHTTTNAGTTNVYTNAPTLKDIERERRLRFSKMRFGG